MAVKHLAVRNEGLIVAVANSGFLRSWRRCLGAFGVGHGPSELLVVAVVALHTTNDTSPSEWPLSRTERTGVTSADQCFPAFPPVNVGRAAEKRTGARLSRPRRSPPQFHCVCRPCAVTPRNTPDRAASQRNATARPNPNHLNNMRAKVASSLKFSACEAKGSNPSSSASFPAVQRRFAGIRPARRRGSVTSGPSGERRVDSEAVHVIEDESDALIVEKTRSEVRHLAVA